MVERITSRRLTLCTLPALRGSNLPRPRAQRMCCGVHTESSADRSEMGKIDRSRRRRGCAGALRHKICTASLDNAPLIDGFVSQILGSPTRARTVDAARRAGYQWPEKLGPRLVEKSRENGSSGSQQCPQNTW